MYPILGYLPVILVNILLFRHTWQYNLDLEHPIIASHQDSSYFGFSVLLHSHWMIIGAPRSNYTSIPRGTRTPREPGAVFRCDLDSGTCEQFKPSNTNDDSGFVEQIKYYSLIVKESSWFGAAIALQEDSNLLTVCAPRAMLVIHKKIEQHNSMYGICYSGQVDAESLQIEDPSLPHHDFLSRHWYNSLHGFSLHYPSVSSTNVTSNQRLIKGSPRHELDGSVTIQGRKDPVMLPIDPDNCPQFGYAVSSGRFFDKAKLQYVGGAPNSQLVGQVAIIDPDTDPAIIVSKLAGSTVGEYFGASLATGDVNNDGLDDLIVGAPHWGNDNGRIYIYFGNEDGFHTADVIRDGPTADSCFGYSLACGDLDADGYADIIIGAPWEGNGAVYIFNGDSKNRLTTGAGDAYLHRISAKPAMRAFGFSLSNVVDTDANGFADIAVGAYKSSHAILYHSRPVVKTSLRARANPRSLRQDSTNFLVTICVEHVKKGQQTVESFNLTLDVDQRFERVNHSQVSLNYISRHDKSEICLNTTIFLKRNVRNFIDPIDIVVTHEFGNYSFVNKTELKRCTLCPVESKGGVPKTTHLPIFFEIGHGADGVYVADLLLSANFVGARQSWIIGSEDIGLDIRVENRGEPAYSTTVTLELPGEVSLRRLLSSCTENNDEDTVKVICNVDNPLVAGNPKSMIFDLDMSRLIDRSANGTFLNFNATVSTRSDNRGTTNVSLPLLLLSRSFVIIDGKAHDSDYDYASDEQSSSNMSFKHSYQIIQSGATPIAEAQLNVRVPYGIGNKDLVMLTNKPRIFVSGILYMCSIIDIPVWQRSNVYGPSILKEESAETFSLNSDDKLRTRRDVGHVNKSLTERGNNESSDGVHLNCSLPNVHCGMVTCLLSDLRSDQDASGLQLQFSVNISSVKSEGKDVAFVTEAWMDFVKPVGTGLPSSSMTRVLTTFHKIEKSKRINIWIIVGSVLLGLAVLLLIALGLGMMGFFKRKKKTELTAMKAKNVDSNGNGS